MPSLFFSYDRDWHNQQLYNKKKRVDPRIKRAILWESQERERLEKDQIYQNNQLRACVSASELAKKKLVKHIALEKEWRKRHRVAVQLRDKYEVEYINQSQQRLDERDERLRKRLNRRNDLLGMYGNVAQLAYTNSGYF